MILNSLRPVVLCLVALFATYASAQNSDKRLAPKKVEGCALLKNAGKLNGRMVQVRGVVNTDFEHFDLRFACPGYINLQISVRDDELAKFGFKTVQNEDFKRLMDLTNAANIGTDCLSCEPSSRRVEATITGRFRCHYDFPDCSDISPYGDSSIVVLSVKGVKKLSTKAPKRTNGPSVGTVHESQHGAADNPR